MDFKEIRKCDFCDHAVAGNTRDGKSIDFYRLVLERLLLNVQAINERMGLAMMMGGNEALAGAMASHDTVAVPWTRQEFLVCHPCWREKGFEALHDTGDKGKELPISEAEKELR